MIEIFDRQPLAVWLKFANGSSEPVDTHGDREPDPEFASAVTRAECVRLDLTPIS